MIINETKGKLLAKTYSTYNGMWQMKGLMFSRKKAALFPFSMPRKVSVHTAFVFYPIDLVFLDSEKRVVEKKRNMHPFSTYRANSEASYMIELPNDLGRTVSIGDLVSFSH